MTLHIFNPEHELALAANQTTFTPPHAGRQLRSDLGFLPALWAKKGDYILVDDVEASKNAYRKLKLKKRTEVCFVTLSDLKTIVTGKRVIDIQPWGWNKALQDQLLRAGMPQEAMPSLVQLDTIRELSSRRLAVKMLDYLKDVNGVTGFSRECDSYEEVLLFLDRNFSIVVKSPWSSSGRGVRYLDASSATFNALQWMVNVIARQRSIIAEVKCQKVMDFAVEFMAFKNRKVKACGLSLFKCDGTAYKGNLLATENEKLERLAQYIPLTLLDEVNGIIEQFLSQNIDGAYVGPLGVDMMICVNPNAGKDGEPPFFLNPCVEINMRRTMGHAALALSRYGHRGLMMIDYEAKSYKLKLMQNQ